MEDVLWAAEVESKDFDDVVVIMKTEMNFGADFVPFQSLLTKILGHLL